MERRLITFAPTFLRLTTVDWDIDWREQSSGTSTSGRRNIDIGRLPRWIGSPKLEFHPDRIAQWRATRWAARGMTGVFRIRMADYINHDPYPTDSIPFSDGSMFTDGSGFLQDYTVRCDVGAAAGATEIVVNMATASETIQVGQILSHNDLPFGVTAIMDDTLHIEMPLRQAIPAGDLIDLRGTGLFEMVDARTGNPAYDASLMARPEFSLQEWLR